jgi:hypothetical protein
MNAPRNEEDAITAAIQQYTQANGMGDPRALARFVLAELAKFKAQQ